MVVFVLPDTADTADNIRGSAVSFRLRFTVKNNELVARRDFV